MSYKESKNLNVLSVKNLHIAGDNIEFQWEQDAGEFRQYNVIYGRNGSGKSTITRMFDNINEYGNNNLQLSGSASQDNIRVFSREYVNKNLYFNEIDNDAGEPGIKLIDVGFGKKAKKANDLIKKNKEINKVLLTELENRKDKRDSVL